MATRIATGTVEGTGSALNVQCGFQPTIVKVTNIDGDAEMEWTDQYADGTAYKTIADGTSALIATGGVTPYAGTAASDSEGFTIGADTDVNAAAETINWYAIGAD